MTKIRFFLFFCFFVFFCVIAWTELKPTPKRKINSVKEFLEVKDSLGLEFEYPDMIISASVAHRRLPMNIFRRIIVHINGCQVHFSRTAELIKPLDSSSCAFKLISKRYGSAEKFVESIKKFRQLALDYGIIEFYNRMGLTGYQTNFQDSTYEELKNNNKKYYDTRYELGYESYRGGGYYYVFIFKGDVKAAPLFEVDRTITKIDSTWSYCRRLRGFKSLID
jgi:hypothetical protein